ncbi:thioredoxin domain-containing protein [Desertivirga brevis]|uniref:thioredoxin domain-containing protein n=1 Tax=Desertivirga brevis TaxID=2810310 RepID=UPI001A95C5FA|nr:thioredoxin domain-containing protein [Pedobacter sp. SYSU D00873]
MPNRLFSETSPYLLQHANNPVDWYPWGMEALQKARRENKLIIVSVGYSACHWCHVMEHESFEDPEVAAIMNEHFVSIKVDREERPDIDQIYMTAVQLISGRGGWPMNVVCLPDQRPIYGGTYYPKDNWKSVLLNLVEFWKEKPGEAFKYAEQLTSGIKEAEILNLSDDEITYTPEDLDELFKVLKPSFDFEDGGYNRYPKFPMPNNWQFLIRYAYFTQEPIAIQALEKTLDKMALGGIFDQIGGGFSRYSVDRYWHIPHFEKMLYDNGQLLSLYSEAYQFFKRDLYKTTVYEIVSWLQREMVAPNGGFYSALDADSEGVEGKYYSFTLSEIEGILGEESPLICEYFDITQKGNWEEEKTNVLRRKVSDSEFAQSKGLPLTELQSWVEKARNQLFEYRGKRVRPGLDNKIMASWNGLMLKGLTDAYKAFSDRQFLDLAFRNASFIKKNLMGEKGQLQRLYTEELKGTPPIAFLDDYAFVVDAFIGLYEVTFDEIWLKDALRLTNYVLTNFYDPGTGMLYYTAQTGEELIARKHEIMDNVIPASNSAMALNLYKLGHFFDHQPFIDQSLQMLASVFPSLKAYPSAYSNWAILLFNEAYEFFEIAVTGEEFEKKRKEIEQHFIPNKIIMGGLAGELPLLEDKFNKDTKIYVCRNKSCLLPVKDVEEALKQLK